MGVDIITCRNCKENLHTDCFDHHHRCKVCDEYLCENCSGWLNNNECKFEEDDNECCNKKHVLTCHSCCKRATRNHNKKKMKRIILEIKEKVLRNTIEEDIMDLCDELLKLI